MEKKNMVLLTVIAVATLLVAVVGATFAYFTATSSLDPSADEETGKTNIKTADITNKSVVANVQGSAGKFDQSNIYPGHMEVAALSVKVTTEEGATVSVPFIYDVTENTISKEGGKVVAYLYKSETEVQFPTTKLGCELKVTPNQGLEGKDTYYKEECAFKNAASTSQNPTTSNETDSEDMQKLSLVAKEELKGGAQTIQLATESITTEGSTPKTVYYYFVLHYENEESDQNQQSNQTLTGTLRVA